MLGKTSKPVIEILTGSLVSASRDMVGTSPRGLKNFDFGGVGLGIVVALEKSGGRSDVPANQTLFGRNITGSSPIPVSSTKNSWRKREEMEMESLEEYTIVTCHDPNKTYTTKVYPHAPPTESGRKGDDRTPFRIKSSSNRPSVFHISPARHGGRDDAPAPDFLSSCNLCHKKLHGKDIYMYRGEKAFCSTECRYRQMVADDRKEKCGAEAARSATEAAGSPYTNGGCVFTTGILAI